MRVIYIFLLLAVLWDCALLKKLNAARFYSCFNVSFLYKILTLLTTGMFLFASIDDSAMLAYFLACVFLPIYFFRRKDFFQSFVADENEGANDLIMADALGVVLGWLVSSLYISLILESIKAVRAFELGELSEILLTTFFSSAVAVILIVRISRRMDPSGFKSLIKWIKPAAAFRHPIGTAIFAGVVFGFTSARMVVSRGVQPQTPLSDIVAANDSTLAIFGFVVMALFVAPLIEEMMFRGYFYAVLSRYFNPRVALYVIALTFVFMHVGQYWGDWLAIIMVFILGLILTLMRARTQSIIPSVVLHYVYNASVVVITGILLVQSYPDYFKFKAYEDHLNFSEKEELLLKSIEKRPDFTESYHDLAWLYFEEGKDLNEALSLVDAALNIDPQNKVYLDTKVEILSRMGRTEEVQKIRNGCLIR